VLEFPKSRYGWLYTDLAEQPLFGVFSYAFPGPEMRIHLVLLT
jgi:hypothetical protein